MYWNGEIESVLNKNDIYIYGAGEWGSVVVKYCIHNNIRVNGIIVSDLKNNIDMIYGINVMQLSPDIEKNCMIVIAINGDKKEIVRGIEGYGLNNYIELDSIPKGYSGYEYNCQLEEKYYEDELKLLYWFRCRKVLDFNNLKTFNEKIQWIKLYGTSNLMTELADKYKVRDWVSKKIGSEYLVPLIGVWDDFDDIDIDALPESFVMKCNHGSGMNFLVKDKKDFDRDYVKKRFDEWMNINFAYYGFEMQYKDIVPKIIVEEYLEDNPQEDLKDYKLFVFDGKVEYIQIDVARYHGHKRAILDRNGNYVDGEIGFQGCDIVEIPEVPFREKMISLTEKLGQGFAHVRVDLYCCKESIYFGEMTFTHGSGMEYFKPVELAESMGDLIDIGEL